MYKIFLICIAIFFAGCAPKYVTKVQYVPSSNDGFTGCVSKYEQEKIICTQNCSENYQICLDDAFQRAQDIYQVELSKYAKLYDDYLFRLREYRNYKYDFDRKYRILKDDYYYFSNECDKKKRGFTCRRKHELRDTLFIMKRDRLKRPIQPRKPSLNVIVKNQQSFCKSSCGCLKDYDRGYENCGGQIIVQKQCVENCD